jgi:hypothetical protein
MTWPGEKLFDTKIMFLRQVSFSYINNIGMGAVVIEWAGNIYRRVLKF